MDILIFIGTYMITPVFIMKINCVSLGRLMYYIDELIHRISRAIAVLKFPDKRSETTKRKWWFGAKPRADLEGNDTIVQAVTRIRK